jgi:hypothetical protein
LDWANLTDESYNTTLKSDIENIISELQNPSGQGNIDTGWDQGLRKKWKDWYEDLDRKIMNGEELPSPLLAARAMDFDGVGRTDISSIAARIDNRINRGERY